jgi:hypothetical protein
MTIDNKQTYCAPKIDVVQLDTEISLQLESSDNNPPTGPDEARNIPTHFNNSPYLNSIG